MTEQERISREALLRRAAALAGAVYVAPVLSSTAAAELERPRRCRVGRKCDTSRDCRNRKKLPCTCCPEGTQKAFTCQKSMSECGGGNGGCDADTRCTQDRPPCASAQFCDEGQGQCICFVIAPAGRGLGVECVNYCDCGGCSGWPPCDKATGEGCPPGHCCLDTCCPEGICGMPCSRGFAGPRIARGSGGSGPQPTL
jgi:hypothetical protein